jgi:carotenoid 1,2-hydratase
LGFNTPVAPGGYAWWYVDALSDDGAYGLAVIGFIGSVFSPYYALARYRAAQTGTIVDPTNHCAINVALYGRDRTRWAMTERGRSQLQTSADSLAIGPSAMTWEGDALVIRLDEVAAPFPRRIRGIIRLFPEAVMSGCYTLNPEGNHLWRPIAPVSRIEVDLTEPALRWSGIAYCDHNRGGAPIAQGFRSWTWSRAPLRDGAAVFYDGVRKDGDAFGLGLRFDRSGNALPVIPPPVMALPPSKWRISRSARSEADSPARVIETLEDTPFYARSLIAARIEGEEVQAVHESLSVDRLTRTAVQLMLPFRMPRRA